ncbi:unnamed protein product [Calicophoron daubneyi]|uniref:Uncharacterized protein n=1 Tax=Calicophoron daubneyi TaxID=300641 RepID=A0AAV2T2M9_CALDB
MDPVSGRAHKFLISFVLLTNFILRGVDVHTILTDPQLSPNNVECVPQDMDTDRSTSICDDVHIVEFGPCGSVVKLNKDLVYRKTLRIYFETIFEAADVAESIIKPKPESMYAAVLLRENKFIEWIVLFLKVSKPGNTIE